MYRNDSWGVSYKNGLTSILNDYLPNSTIVSIQYNPFSDASITEATILEKIEILSTSRPCVVFAGLDEITSYIAKVYNDPIYRVYHFGSDGTAFNLDILSNEDHQEFLNTIKLESVFYFGHNSTNNKRHKFLGDFDGDVSSGTSEISMYTYTYYDAMKCIHKNDTAEEIYSYLENYHGLTGYIEVESGNRREYGTTHSIFVANNKHDVLWRTASSLNTKTQFETLKTSKISNLDESYKLSFTNEYQGFPVTVSMIDAYGLTTTYTITNADELTCFIADTITVTSSNKVFLISDSMGVKTLHSINGAIVDRDLSSRRVTINEFIPSGSDITWGSGENPINEYHG